MPGNFVSSSPAPKMRHGRHLHGRHGARAKVRPDYPNTASFASKSVPSFTSRKAKQNPKHGFNTEPAKAEPWKASSR
jgi:hypothetical protein